jgi:hypothetical protein
MRFVLKYVLLSALIAGIAVNYKDIRRYLRIRNM